MNNFILDASAILALMFEEQGHENVMPHIPGKISALNVAEVITVLCRNGASQIIAEQSFRLLKLEVIPFDFSVASLSGQLISATKKYGLSLGDRGCIATGMTLKLPVITMDRIWCELDLPNTEILCCRD
jgi:ribonuclease VapC